MTSSGTEIRNDELDPSVVEAREARLAERDALLEESLRWARRWGRCHSPAPLDLRKTRFDPRPLSEVTGRAGAA